MKNKALIGLAVLILILVNSTAAGQDHWYYKPGYPDYCNFGVPDFDQRQDGWSNTAEQWNHCGPVALANCFWWFDSKYDTSTVPPPDSIDTYPLVRAYGSGDDHDTSNVLRLVNQLATCMETDSIGTDVLTMEDCVVNWLIDAGLAGDYYESTYVKPTFKFIENQVKSSQDVILLLGFYEIDADTMDCWRLGGHYVAVSGVNSMDSLIAVSDPYFDVSDTASDSTVHNDADSVSHDIYQVLPNIQPCDFGGGWMLGGYADDSVRISNFFGINKNPEIQDSTYEHGSIITVVEYAVIICPKICPPDEFSVTTGLGRLDLSGFTGVILEAEAGPFNSPSSESVMYSTYPVSYFSGEVAYWPATSPHQIWLRNDSGNPVPQYGGPGVEWIDFDFTALGDTLYYCEFGVQFGWSDANDGWADIYINYDFSQPIASVNTKNLKDNWLCVKGLPVPVTHLRVAQRGGSPGSDHVSVDYVATPNPPPAEQPDYSDWYFKPPDHAEPESCDYAPSGMPDFDQQQDNWKKDANYTFCGPVAVANCFWWFDSKYQNPKGTPGDGVDHFPLVRDYLDSLTWPPAGWTLALPPASSAKQDDHRYDDLDHPDTQWPPTSDLPTLPYPFVPGDQSPPLPLSSWGELVERLAQFMNTDSPPFSFAYGTEIDEMEKGIRKWLITEGLSGFFEVHKIQRPSFPYIDDEVRASEDVILLLGFWEYDDSENHWYRVGGHYVTVAGIYFKGDTQKIALSDPYIDWAERGGAGIIRNSPWSPHPAGVHTSEFHNDPGNASHDFYGVSPAAFPQAGSWQLDGYVVGSPTFVEKFDKQNFPEELVSEYRQYDGGSVYSIVEYAIIMSPRDCPFIKELWTDPCDENLRGEQDLLPGDTAQVCLRVHNVDTESCYLDSVVFLYSKITLAYGSWLRIGRVIADTELSSGDSVTLCHRYDVPAGGHGGIKSILYSRCCPPEEDLHNVWIKDNSDCNDKHDTFEVEILTPNQIELEIIKDLPPDWNATISPTNLLPGLNKLTVVISADSQYVQLGQRAKVRVIGVLEDEVVGEATFIKDISFVPGDLNADSTVDVSDIDFLISYLFRRGVRPVPMEAADVNANGVVNMADATYLIHYIYRNGDPPPCQ